MNILDKYNINYSISNVTELGNIQYIMTKYFFRVYFNVTIGERVVQYDARTYYSWVERPDGHFNDKSDPPVSNTDIGMWCIDDNGIWSDYNSNNDNHPHIQSINCDPNTKRATNIDTTFYYTQSIKDLCEKHTPSDQYNNIHKLHKYIQDKLKSINELKKSSKPSKPSKELLVTVINSDYETYDDLYNLVNQIYGVDQLEDK